VTVPLPRETFGALRHRNFRLFLAGQFVSLTGTWMQTVAQGWLVLKLTNSAFQVGLVTTLGTLPVLLFTLYGGVVADRVNKRRFVLALQGCMLLQALALALLTQSGQVTVVWVMVLASLFGTLGAFEIPARQAFLAEMVGRDDLMNAIALNSSVFNVTRVIGPAIAGILIATVGIAACFFLNAVSYVAVLVMLGSMRPPYAGARTTTEGTAGFGEGLRYILGRVQPRALAIQTTVFSIFGFSFATMLPVYADRVLHTGASGYGALMSGVGIGAAGSALFLAGFGHRLDRDRAVYATGALFGLTLIAAGLAGQFAVAFVLLTLAGCTWAMNAILTNTLLQTTSPDFLRGRVMGFYSFMVVGMAPFGSLQAGWVSEHWGVGFAIAMGGLVCLLTALAVGRLAGGSQAPATI
jgi:MFS family permease